MIGESWNFAAIFLPVGVFFALLFFARGELGVRGLVVAVVVWGALLGVFLGMGFGVYYFAVAQAVLDVILVLVVFGGDIRIS